MTENPRLARILDLIPFIFTHQGISIQELAEKFGCSEKEIYQDLDMLLDCGLPGHTPLEAIDVIFEEGFVYIRNSEELKNPRTLTQAEIATQLMGLELLGSENNQKVTELKNKLSRLLKTNVAYAPSETDRYVALLQEAIQNSNLVQIQYGASTRQVIPNELYVQSSEVYLRAFCKTASDWRTFKLSKINAAEVLEKSELPPNSKPSSSKQFSANLKVHRNQRLVREIFGGIETVQFFSEEWFISQVLSLGSDVEVLTEPYRSQVREKAMASENLYLG